MLGMTMLDPNQVIAVPHTPPESWFTEIPEWYKPDHSLVQIKLDGPEAGRVAALVAPWGECILDGKEGCFTAPQSPTNYEFAHVGTTITEEGKEVRTGNIGGNVDHAPTNWSMSPAVSHYANTATRIMRGRYQDGPNGVIFLGAMWPGTTIAHALDAIASAISGDWRWVQTLKAYDMAGSQLVNNPGFRPNPLNTQYAITASMAPPDPGMTIPHNLPAVMYGNWDPAPSPTPFSQAEKIKGRLISSRMNEIPVVPLADPIVAPEPIIGDMLDPETEDDDEMIDAVVASILGCGCDVGSKTFNVAECARCNGTGILPHSSEYDQGYDVAELPDSFLGGQL